MPTDRDPDYDADLALVRAYDCDPKRGLGIAVIDVATNDVDHVRAACEAAEWGGGYSITTGRDDRVVVTTVFDPRGCPIDDIAEAVTYITGDAATVADEREAPVPPEDVHRSYSTEPDPMTRRVRSKCACGWRSSYVTNGGLAGAAWDAHFAEAMK